jgi:radical SAM protein with 4Fe4S-binding SPASM domain
MSPEDLEVAIGVLGRLIANPPRLLVISGGEPTSRDTKLKTAIVAARKNGLNPRLNTNGYSLNSSVAEFLAEHDVLTQVSLDGVDPQTHALLRKAEDAFERTLSAIERLTSHGVRVRISFTVHSGNAHQIPAMLNLADGLGVEQVVTSSLVGVGNALLNNLKPVEFADEFAILYNAVKDSPSRQRMTRSTLLAETISAIRAGIRFTYCGTGLSTCCVDADGSVYPCINMVRAPFKGGNICDKDFPEKWGALWPGLRNLDVDSMNPQCARCFCRYFCGAYCRGETLESGKGIRDPYVRCSSWKKALIRVFDYLSQTPDIFAFEDDPIEAIIHRE